MAAIDKLYLKNYDEYDQLRRWAIVYYPELLLSLYNISLSWERFIEHKDEWVQYRRREIESNYEKIGDFKTLEEAVTTMMKLKREIFGDNAFISDIQVKYEVEGIIENYNKTTDELCDEYSFPVMNCPFSVDRKLKWICPLPFVREYLHEQCGVNPKWEWLYKLFWKGKKYFL